MFGAFFNAIYAAFLKIKVPAEKEGTFNYVYFLGFIGLINDVVIIPIFFIFNWTGIEKFEIPTKHTFFMLAV